MVHHENTNAKDDKNDCVAFSDSSSGSDNDLRPLNADSFVVLQALPHWRRHSRCKILCFVSLFVGGVSCIIFFLYPSIIVKSAKWQQGFPPLTCYSPTIDRLSVVAPGTPVIPPGGYNLVQATVHQRHLDRWMYSHPYINNNCWSNQLNSTDPIMHAQCTYNLSSVWDTASFDKDPYSDPARGSCNPKQLTIQGQEHAEALGRAYRKMFPDVQGGVLCSRIKLESDVAQKNQQSTQHVYKGICGSFPDPTQHPAETVLDDGTIELGRPFFLSLGTICDSHFIHEARANASAAFLESSWIPKMKKSARVLAKATGKREPDDMSLAELLDNIVDCTVCHACHGLHDTPSAIWPVFDRVNKQETASRLFVFDGIDPKVRDRFTANYFGYYFVVVMRRMQKALHGGEPLMYVQVTSDDRISALLKTLNADPSMVATRPVWGSQVIFQLLEKDHSFFVRILYNGEEIRLQTWAAFADFVATISPSKEDCSAFYDNIQ